MEGDHLTYSGVDAAVDQDSHHMDSEHLPVADGVGNYCHYVLEVVLTEEPQPRTRRLDPLSAYTSTNWYRYYGIIWKIKK